MSRQGQARLVVQNRYIRVDPKDFQAGDRGDPLQRFCTQCFVVVCRFFFFREMVLIELIKGTHFITSLHV